MEGNAPFSSQIETPFPAAPLQTQTGFVDGRRPVEDALQILERAVEPAIPIIGESGAVIGWLSRQAPLLQAPPPPRLGGMATPLGVYLTDGVWSGGAGFWGLFLTGVVLCALGLFAQGFWHEALTLFGTAAHHPVWKWIDAHPPAIRDLLWEALNYLPLFTMFVMLRLIPLSGIHAAEHQVVHCIERGLPLRREQVRIMPRAHPRCGTNLIVGISIFLLIFLSVFCLAQARFLSVTDSATLALVIAAPVTLRFWRSLGAVMQQWFATKPATDRQIAGGIRAAEQVLAQRQAAGAGLPVRLRLLGRVWSMGVAQVLLGYAAVCGLLFLLLQVWPKLGNLLGN